MSITDAIAYLDNYQSWRSGEDGRTMDEAGLSPKQITAAMDVVLAFARESLAIPVSTN